MTDNVEKIVPRHVTIIMDGNGRWAKKQGQPRLFGHNAGAESVRECCEFAAESGIEYLSLFAFSSENWNRPVDEVSGLMKLMARSLVNERDTLMRNSIRLRVIGDRGRISRDLISQIEKVEDETAGNTRMTMIVMLSYSGKWDIVRAAKSYGEAVAEAVRNGQPVPELDEAGFSSYLATAGIPDPDLMIRTSGEQRISNYMLWQCAYTEFYFTDVLWPDFRKKEFALALEAYRARDRRYGKIK